MNNTSSVRKYILQYLDLIRFFQPIGTLLLLIPCLIGVVYGYKKTDFFDFNASYFLLFISGSFLMRSAGCIINDVMDQNFDKLVKRTRNRKIAAGEISSKNALIFFIFLILAGFFITLYFKFRTFLICIIALILLFIYPLAKRFSNYPQFILGLAFNIGVVIAFIEIYQSLTINIVILYFSLTIWTLIYDSAYAFQDIDDDIKIGIKSAAIKFKEKPKLYFNSLSLLMHLMILYVGFCEKFSLLFASIILTSLLFHLNIIKKTNFSSTLEAFSFFKKNIVNGFLILLAFAFL